MNPDILSNMYRLKVFYEVVNSQSFSSAAEILNISQPAVSAHIRALEKETQVILLDRGRTITTTEAGNHFYNYTKQVLNLSKEILLTLQEVKQGNIGNITVGASTTPARYILPKIISNFMRENPHINLNLRVGNSKQIFQMTLEKEIDFGFIIGKKVPENLTATPIVNTELTLVVGPSHPLATKNHVTPSDISNYPFVVLSSYNYQVIENMLHSRGIKINEILMQYEDIESIKQIISIGNGITILSKLSVNEELKVGKLKQLQLESGSVYLDLMLVARPDKPHYPNHKKFLSFLKDRICIEESVN
ncbi:LysR family transcriptional regulator [Bacillus sp. Marseille-P3661]|uniref:LysR family transcriptional regulator n=1 Tax=Bacillus sp. Marseille-P3661 TaxID=1936234 RepID=UPI000C82856D|nr:LysR family transcriptional regulator [Bacillus sp. Marseille-P3661]